MCCLNLKVAPNWWEGRMVGSQKSISSPLIIYFFASSLAKVSENFQVEGLNSYGRRQCVHTCDKTFSNMPTYKWQPPYNMLLGLRWQHWAVPVMCLANTKTKPVRNPSWKLQYRELTNWRWVNWQTGGGTKSALALFWIDLRKFWQANIRPYIPLNPNMCDMWGGTSHIFRLGASEEKLSALEGFVPPTDFQVSWRIWLGVTHLTEFFHDCCCP